MFDLIKLPFIFAAFIILYPIFVIWTWFGFRSIAKNELDFIEIDGGIELFSVINGTERTLLFEEIGKVKIVFNPPLYYPCIWLRDGEKIKLMLANRAAISKVMLKYKIPFEDAFTNKNT